MAGAGVSSPGSLWSSQVDSVVGPPAERWRRVAVLRGVVRQRRDWSLVEVVSLLSKGGNRSSIKPAQHSFHASMLARAGARGGIHIQSAGV